MERVRTVTWEDPAINLKAARQMTGLEFMQALKAGELPPPPIAALVGFLPDILEPGHVSFRMQPGEYHYNPMGTVHGGITATLCDTVMGCAIQTMLPAGAAYTTLEFKVNFARPITVATGEVVCEGRVIHLGGRTAISEATVRDGEGNVLAHATTTCILLKPGGSQGQA